MMPHNRGKPVEKLVVMNPAGILPRFVLDFENHRQSTKTGLTQLPAIAIFIFYRLKSSSLEAWLGLSCTPISSTNHQIVLRQIAKKTQMLGISPNQWGDRLLKRCVLNGLTRISVFLFSIFLYKLI